MITYNEKVAKYGALLKSNGLIFMAYLLAYHYSACQQNGESMMGQYNLNYKIFTQKKSSTLGNYLNGNTWQRKKNVKTK